MRRTVLLATAIVFFAGGIQIASAQEIEVSKDKLEMRHLLFLITLGARIANILGLDNRIFR